ncbi:hypothetical protein MGYG_02764 [Nannizzia gypsea CBS 118893]|uniref:Uncharacterized protein n=1 Tax=Arthroderma gypseum (strain ATCC MYA-4604 / CBS 118893) TaxID=535722 RepID=E4UNZ8_ARTGP|nr:hypothetical protein MGYG_02764 [Nannizzia gypsea CBS 118893]EFQ99751.1 hypothetical protein MGYG_02764 [Nannizzia gypsea CBS 118893]
MTVCLISLISQSRRRFIAVSGSAGAASWQETGWRWSAESGPAGLVSWLGWVVREDPGVAAASLSSLGRSFASPEGAAKMDGRLPVRVNKPTRCLALRNALITFSAIQLQLSMTMMTTYLSSGINQSPVKCYQSVL